MRGHSGVTGSHLGPDLVSPGPGARAGMEVGWRLRAGAGSLRGTCGAAELSPQLGNRLYRAGRCGALGSGWFQGAHTCDRKGPLG